MIHYSVIPSDVIFQGMDTFEPAYVEIEYNGIKMQIEPMKDYQARIIRIYSSDPQDYLKEQYTPGTVIAYSPGFNGQTG